jgi:hypothetical protein
MLLNANPNSHNFRAISQFISKMDLSVMGLEEGWRKELAQDQIETDFSFKCAYLVLSYSQLFL